MRPHWVPDRPLTGYFIAAYLLNVIVCCGFSSLAATPDLSSKLYVYALCVTYPLIYMLPLVILGQLTARIGRVQPFVDGGILLLSSLITVLLVFDVKLYSLYGFHINVFVINLVLTPGGIASLGTSDMAIVMAGFGSVAILLVHLLLYRLMRHHQSRIRVAQRYAWTIALVFLSLTLGERVVYGISDIARDASILKAANAIPLYNQVTFRSFGRRLGYEPRDREEIGLESEGLKLQYPLRPLESAETQKPLNIIWLVSESMRWDQLSNEVMPRTWAQSQAGLRFTRHYSGGNGTRQGLFALFYGLYGSYWDAFLQENRSPVLIDHLLAEDYQVEMFTSASFTYPEFDQTLFAALSAEQLHQFDNDMSPWQRDVANTGQIVDLLRDREEEKPFMVFMFYESTHARYDFPETSVIRAPYLEDLNYATMTRESLADKSDGLFNRYMNASHFIDEQLGRIYDALEEQGLWDNTIVVVTGDHGEEFMENGFWGHNSGFSEQQIRTPMVMWLPGEEPAVVTKVTSHTDVIPTIMPMLGVRNAVEEYALGYSMVDTEESPFIVVSDWAGLCYLGDDYKFTVPLNSSLANMNALYDNQDREVDNIAPFMAKHRESLGVLLTNAKRFSQPTP